jgi:hypothetical protein
MVQPRRHTKQDGLTGQAGDASASTGMCQSSDTRKAGTRWEIIWETISISRWHYYT